MIFKFQIWFSVIFATILFRFWLELELVFVLLCLLPSTRRTEKIPNYTWRCLSRECFVKKMFSALNKKVEEKKICSLSGENRESSGVFVVSSDRSACARKSHARSMIATGASAYQFRGRKTTNFHAIKFITVRWNRNRIEFTQSPIIDRPWIFQSL